MWDCHACRVPRPWPLNLTAVGPVENRVSVDDWHATILHLLGLYHEDLFFERNGFAEKLTSTSAPRIIQEIIA